MAYREPAFTLGIMCNALVCLAVWMCFSARTNIDRVVTAVPPIAAFAAAGFEHCVANVYFIPMGLFIKAGAPESFWKAVNKTAADFPDLTWSNFICNLAPVTAGNIVLQPHPMTLLQQLQFPGMASMVREPRLTAPWSWNLGDVVQLVYGLVFRRP